MNNKKIFNIVTASAIAIAIALAIVSFSLSLSLNKTVDKLEANRDCSSIHTTHISNGIDNISCSDSIYMLKEYNGIVGIFNEAGILVDTLDINVKSLPRQDQIMLGTGIWAMSRQELAALIEDYTG